MVAKPSYSFWGPRGKENKEYWSTHVIARRVGKHFKEDRWISRKEADWLSQTSERIECIDTNGS
jgi:hypothetical protein